ncbi:TonB-dependent receptor plug domain-containing protein [Hahella sp. NBU794]|uniref:TonB-dependent receptor plug domain-containing protein n=1 Tax=Hahella sp. NBU794 TaxID=3422590 RepID=UPI003D6F9892
MKQRPSDLARIAGCWLMALFSTTVSASRDDLVLDIKGASLEQLMGLKISTLSRKQELLARAPAAVYVITRDDIRRMGVTHIAEALRYVPGLEVNRFEGGKWSVSARGFSSATTNANKMLVLIDGRSIYSMLYSGVLWEEKDVMLEDVDRIEVVRGPGGTLWGANAVNGVINIITRNAAETQGGAVTVGAGLEERGLYQQRYGWKVGEEGFARIYGKGVYRDNSGGLGTEDDSEHLQTGFRVDLGRGRQDEYTIQGDYYRGEAGSTEDFHGGNLMFNWSHTFSEQRSQQLLFYFDNTVLETTGLDDKRDIWNLEYQLRNQFGFHDVVAGLGYRAVHDEVLSPSETSGLRPERRSDEVKNLFIQDEIKPFGENFRFIAGTKYEVNDYSGEEWQPSVRLAYDFPDAILWASWSRAVRVPTRLEHDLYAPGLVGAQSLLPERAKFYEVGGRKSWKQWTLDLSAYHGEYDDLRTIGASGIHNEMTGDVRGVEVSLDYKPNPIWRLRLNASHMEMDMEPDPSSVSLVSAESLEDASPRDMAQLISYSDISPSWSLNAYLRYVDRIQYSNIPSFLVADLSVVWKPTEDLRAQWVLRHLGDPHPESVGLNGEVESDAAFYLGWEF